MHLCLVACVIFIVCLFFVREKRLRLWFCPLDMLVSPHVCPPSVPIKLSVDIGPLSMLQNALFVSILMLSDVYVWYLLHLRTLGLV
jgi:hypothetical protein